MKLCELRLRGCLFTLGAVVKENDFDFFRELISYLQDNTTDENAEVPVTFDLVPTDAYPLSSCEELSKWLLEKGYATKDGVTHTLTEKTFEVFKKTIEKDKELLKKGFSYCPFHWF